MILLPSLRLFWLLILAHFAVDVQFQSDFVAKFKCRCNSLALLPWAYVLSSHAATHALVVWLLTGSLVVATLEFACHWLIDWAKCEGLTGIHTDQMLHVLCKVVWVAGLAAWGGLAVSP